MKVEKSLSARLSLLASFVWSKSIDDADSVIPGLFDSVGAQDEGNLRIERGLSFDNPGRRIAAGYVYRLPTRIRRVTELDSQRNRHAAGWNAGQPVLLRARFREFGHAQPARISCRAENLFRCRAALRSSAEFSTPEPSRPPAPYTYGDAGRDIINGPGNNIFDVALARRFPIREQDYPISRRSFNVVNHPNWGIPGPNPDFGPFFGRSSPPAIPAACSPSLRYDF